jgi:integrase/recombinase XerD
MQLVFTRRDLLNDDLDGSVLGVEFERIWREQHRAIAKRALVTAGVDDRVPFVLQSDGAIDRELSELFRIYAGQTSGRTTMASYGHHAIRFVRWIAGRGLTIASVTPAHLADYRRLRNGSGIESGSWNSEAAAIKSLFDAASITKVRSDNPCKFPTLVWYNGGARIEPKAPDFVTLSQFERFRDEGLGVGCYGLRNVAFANLLLTSGMRLDEANEYRIEWFPTLDVVRNAAGRSIPHQITAEAAKGHRPRKVRISKAALDSMRMYCRSACKIDPV